MSDERVDDVKELFRGESEVYCFDFQDFPQRTAGQTINSATVVVSSGPATPVLTLGAPSVTAEVFEQLDRDGNVEQTVPAGSGVKVRVTATAVGGAKGECVVTCLPAWSGGGTQGKRCKFVVK